MHFAVDWTKRIDFDLLRKERTKSLNEQIINEIDKFSTQKQGSARLKFMVHDREDNLYIEMFSRNKRVNLSDELIKFLEAQPEIDFKLN